MRLPVRGVALDVQLRDVRRVVGVAAFAALVACAMAPPRVAAPLPSSATEAQRYLGDAVARRRMLEAELVNPTNGYSRLRLAHYATGKSEDWDALPEYNPKAAPWATPLGALAPLAITPAARAGDPEALRALGEAAFDRYPVQIATAAERVVTDEASARRFGFWVDGGRIGGLVRVQTPDGVPHLAYACATCHTGVRRGKLVTGAPCETLDIGALSVAAFRGGAPAFLAWGPGRIDVTTPGGTEPVRIPDLRAVRDLSFLHHTASVAQRGVTSLAIRVETLVIVSNSRTIRPPREIALGLALYLWSLEDRIPHRDSLSPEEKHGEVLFTAHCASCHAPPSYTGKPVPITEVGTDGHLGGSAERGTGAYRVPTLRGIADRGPLLHDASIATTGELLDPARLEPGWRGGPVLGHRYGLGLTPGERADLEAFVETL